MRVFSQDCPDVSMESIAADAGVGAGRLYRNFPIRHALIEAAYRSELARLCAGVPELLRRSPTSRRAPRWIGSSTTSC